MNSRTNSQTTGWTTYTIGDQLSCSRACDVFYPQAPNPHGDGILWLHDEADAASSTMARSLDHLWEQHGLTVIAPDGGQYWWLDRMLTGFSPTFSPQSFLTDIVVPWIEQHLGLQPPRLAAVGLGMGGHGALMLSYQNPAQFPVVAAIAPKIDFHLLVGDGHAFLSSVYEEEEYARQDTAILHIHPLNWPRQQFFCCDPADAWFDGSDRLRMKLASTGIPFECDLETTVGESTTAAADDVDVDVYLRRMAPRVVEFVTKRLETERMRLL